MTRATRIEALAKELVSHATSDGYFPARWYGGVVRELRAALSEPEEAPAADTRCMQYRGNRCIRDAGHEGGHWYAGAPSPLPAAAPPAPDEEEYPMLLACLVCGTKVHPSNVQTHCAGTPAEREARASIALDGETHDAEAPRCPECGHAPERHGSGGCVGADGMGCDCPLGSGQAPDAGGER